MRGSDPSPIVTRVARPDDAALLTELGASTFAETFESANTPEDFSAYMATAFGEDLQRVELEDPDTTVFFAERDGEAGGYVMLRDGAQVAGCLGNPDLAGTTFLRGVEQLLDRES